MSCAASELDFVRPIVRRICAGLDDNFGNVFQFTILDLKSTRLQVTKKSTGFTCPRAGIIGLVAAEVLDEVPIL